MLCLLAMTMGRIRKSYTRAARDVRAGDTHTHANSVDFVKKSCPSMLLCLLASLSLSNIYIYTHTAKFVHRLRHGIFGTEVARYQEEIRRIRLNRTCQYLLLNRYTIFAQSPIGAMLMNCELHTGKLSHVGLLGPIFLRYALLGVYMRAPLSPASD